VHGTAGSVTVWAPLVGMTTGYNRVQKNAVQFFTKSQAAKFLEYEKIYFISRIDVKITANIGKFFIKQIFFKEKVIISHKRGIFNDIFNDLLYSVAMTPKKLKQREEKFTNDAKMLSNCK